MSSINDPSARSNSRKMESYFKALSNALHLMPARFDHRSVKLVTMSFAMFVSHSYHSQARFKKLISKRFVKPKSSLKIANCNEVITLEYRQYCRVAW